MKALLNNAVVFYAALGLGYSLVVGDELFAYSFFVTALTTLSLYSDNDRSKEGKSPKPGKVENAQPEGE
jgi:hypothetical protein